MLKSRSFLLALAAITISFLTGIADAQDSDIRVGVGVSIDPPRLFMTGGSNVYSNVLTPVNIYVPIGFSHVRIEPEIGMYSYSNQSTLTGTTGEQNLSIVHAGVGGFYLISMDSQARLYVGPRVGLNFISSKFSSSGPSGTFSSETSETDVVVGVNIGGEYLLSSHFSVGGEAQLNYLSFGKQDNTVSPAPVFTNPSPDESRHLISTNVLFFFRWFF